MGRGQGQRHQPNSRMRLGPLAGAPPESISLPGGRISGLFILRDSTGSNWAARVAGTVPKITPTTTAAVMATATDQGEIGSG